MSYYTICPYCDARLDPGEKCDCEDVRAKYEMKKALVVRQHNKDFEGAYTIYTPTTQNQFIICAPEMSR